MKYDKEHFVHDFDINEFRQLIVNFLDENIQNNHIEWISGDGYGSKSEWVKKMSANAWCDEVFLRLVAIFLNRRIIVYPIFGKKLNHSIIVPHESCDCDKSEQNENDPLTLLYYEEAHFAGSHYQSIRPKNKPHLPEYYHQNASPNDKNQNISVDEIVEPETTATPNNDITFAPNSNLQSTEINFDSFHSEYLNEKTSPIISKKPKVLKRKNPKIKVTDVDVTNIVTDKEDQKRSRKKTNKQFNFEIPKRSKRK